MGCFTTRDGMTMTVGAAVPSRMSLLLAVAWLSAAGQAQPAAAAGFGGSVVASVAAFDLAPDSDRRLDFTLGADTPGHRVAVRFTALATSEKPTGYSECLALEVNGEVMGLTLAGRPRLLGRPMGFRFGPNGSRKQVAGVPGVLGLIEPQGSARWTLPFTPSVAALKQSEDYAPWGTEGVTRFVVEISDLVHYGSFNYLTVKNEGAAAPIRVQGLQVLVETRPSLPLESPRLAAVYRRLQEQYFGRSALVREPRTGREWVYDMDLVESNYSASDTLAEIQTLDDARRIVSRHRENGCSAIMVSGLHMRYSYVPLWESRILPYMRLLCQAAHEAGLRVIDHYDVPIFFSGGYPFLLTDDHLDWTQRDVRYGTPARMYCLNNPGFRQHFFAWAQRMQRECRIDGYQIDEVYFFDQGYCGCPYCRRQFQADTGFALPHEPDSPVWFNDASGLWRLFNLWRQVSMQRFKRDFLTAVRRENPAALLSDYTSTYHAPSANGGLWPSVFVSQATGTEAMSRVPFETYHEGLADMRLRTGLADAFDHASWVLWYPLTSSTARFCWALSQATGQAQWHMAPMSGAVRDLVTWPDKMRKLDFTTFADVAMIFSEKSKNASQWTSYYHGMEMFGWGAAMADANLQYHNLHEIAVTPQLLVNYKLLILPQMTLIDRENAAAIGAFVRQGGTLVVTGETGMLDEQARPRADFRLGEMMNRRFVDFVRAPFDVVEPDGRRFTFDRQRMLYGYGKRLIVTAPRDPARSRTVVRFVKDGVEYPGITEADYGRGKVYTVAGFLGVSNFESSLEEGEKQIFRCNPEAAAFMGRWLRSVLGKRETLAPQNLPPQTIITSWVRRAPRDEIDVHFLNLQDYQRQEGVAVHRREINFPRVDRPMSVLLRQLPVRQAFFHVPGAEGPVECQLERSAEGTVIRIPPGPMPMYGLLKIHLKGGAR
jgi:hypothetical protein